MGSPALARELKSAAELSQRCQAGSHVPTETSKLQLIEWPDRSNEMARLRDEDRELWDRIDSTYADLGRSKRDGAWPPTPDELLDLADTLTKLGDS